jgi:hypothetical protein
MQTHLSSIMLSEWFLARANRRQRQSKCKCKGVLCRSSLPQRSLEKGKSREWDKMSVRAQGRDRSSECVVSKEIERGKKEDAAVGDSRRLEGGGAERSKC